jgi:hypothetical protein
MKECKLKPGASPTVEIQRNMLERLGLKAPPYYNKADNEIKCFAVCPACDKPVTLIGLYKALKNTDEPFARHVPHDVPNLAAYSQEDYDYCPIANAGLYRETIPKHRQRKMDDKARLIYSVIRNNFGKIAWLIEQDTGLLLSDRLIKDMVSDYLAYPGYLYRNATYENAPWTFAYQTLKYSLGGRYIRNDGNLFAKLSKNDNIYFEQAHPNKADGIVQVLRRDRSRPLNFCFIDHKINVDNGGKLLETMRLVVSQDANAPPSAKDILADELITFDKRYWLNLIDNPTYDRRRTELAQSLMPEL